MLNDPPGFEQEGTYALYMSQVHDCSYLPGREARNLFLDPTAKVTMDLYQQLIDRGFRRSGCYLYQPACPHCNDCISLRIPTKAFEPTRSQRRIWKRNMLAYEVIPGPANFNDEHYHLYKHYLLQRHPDGAMACNNPGQYSQFLTCDWAKTQFIEFRKADKLVAVAVSDLLPNGTSSVYTFYDPQMGRDGLGIFALLWQINHAREQGLQWVYPGFWIENCKKMNYKSRFRPFEAWTGQQWISYTKLIDV
ncbi:MAG: arginyltransferase [Candidatus Thiodiazotropha sp.]|nr:arginyltransferase [Candidatus Thiodiazotropha sp.]MCM8885008.1 arginyltransferase [Candidatus Thiodiazotropha sp.]MCM8921288.1 arginyltransferase [Candidatus Thiodiazotropha sp.]